MRTASEPTPLAEIVLSVFSALLKLKLPSRKVNPYETAFTNPLIFVVPTPPIFVLPANVTAPL